MKLGLSSYAYTWSVGVPGHPPRQPLSPGQLLERAARLSVPVVQFADNIPLHLMRGAEIDALAESAARLGIQVEVGMRGISPQLVKEYLLLAQRFSSRILRIVIDAPGSHHPPDAAVSALRPHRADFERAGVMLAIENHDVLPAKVLARMVQDLGPSWVGVCLDTVNSLGVPEGPGAVVDTLGPWVVNLHLKDFAVVRAEHMMGFAVEGRPAGRGQLDVPWLLESLAAHGREFNAILELWTAPERTLELTIETEQHWVEESVEFLIPLLKSYRRADAGSPQRPPARVSGHDEQAGGAE